ncbi:MAG: glutamate N-acetyltransferase / amino-acid N-acetyltransferase, partial [Solirubrobacteraceae bacterium]|nr:glutamate N-acetyltransferase / amino-acid N-acetyltransferase [Solirubrobacteraceae bacterium]
NLDVGLLVSDAPETTSAARFTASSVLAAPVLVTRDRCDLTGLRAVAVNAGNANAATGGRGMDTAARMQGAAAMCAGVGEAAAAVCSTGVIGVQLDADRVVKGLAAARGDLSADYATFAEAMRTTDAFPKQATLRVELDAGAVTLSAQCKGAGMIQPNFATMLCFVQTDAALDAETCDLLLGVCVKRSFDRVSVDGQLSTNDTAILMASGASGVRVEPQTADEGKLGEALDALLRQLALLMIRDGEGAKRTGRVVVTGGPQGAVDRAARGVANSPLVQAALHGGAPHWGRIAQAVGGALPAPATLDLDIAIENVTVCKEGVAVPHTAPDVTGFEVDYAVTLPGEGAAAEVFFSDLSHDYVTINADYTT